ncbi:hypothetical protein [Gordonia polyisoprenivorans]|uniref:hypothetical protein n=1 Tax=Gordonia polyisoprenivorans TaxID=84595 RepID=UPI0012DBEB9A|nr:hypothetical protein [Gordonia polyisoprenivorans]
MQSSWWVGPLIAAIGLVLGGYYFIDNRRRNKLEVSWTTVRVLTRTSKFATRLTVGYEGRELKNPQLLTVVVRNAGAKDIPSADFDGERSLQFYVGGEILEQIEPGEITPFHLNPPHKIEFGPSKVGAKKSYNISVLVEGEPEFEMISGEHPLLQTDVELLSKNTYIKPMGASPTVGLLAMSQLEIFFMSFLMLAASNGAAQHVWFRIIMWATLVAALITTFANAIHSWGIRRREYYRAERP